MAKKIITIFFLSVFLTQLLPVKELGNLLAGSSMTEELPETEAKPGVDVKLFLFTGNRGPIQGIDHPLPDSYIHFSESIPVKLASDVQTPPPDFI
ncbi:MAG: hypothetical protein ABIR19_05385 [Ginsengibacter sp.]